MSKSLRMTTIALFLLFLLGSSEYLLSKEEDIGDKIAQAYGIKEFGKIEELKFNFNVRMGEKVSSRSWVWRPMEDRVAYFGNGDAEQDISYNRKDISEKASDLIKEIDSRFINDQYWLLFPFHLVWDEGITIDLESEKVRLPIGEGMATKVSVIYPNKGGYTPGDVYELFLDDNNMILEWIYRRGGAQNPTRMTTWEDNNHFGPIIISLNHLGPDNNFRVWFTDVEVKLSVPDNRIFSE